MRLAKIERGLIIRQPWLNLILSGEKTWEMRSKPTKIRGTIALIERGTGMIVGQCEIVCSGESIKNFDIGYGRHLHKVDDDELLEKWHYPWVLSNAVKYEVPIRYAHPKGAVTWVRI